MSFEYRGRCQCGGVTFNLILPNMLNTYIQRACDCDFCTQRKANYFSDPKGIMEICAKEKLIKEKHGSMQAEFLCCRHCGDLIAVVYPFTSGLKGAVNAPLLDDSLLLQPPVSVSPRLLSPAEKLERWEKGWLQIAFK